MARIVDTLQGIEEALRLFASGDAIVLDTTQREPGQRGRPSRMKRVVSSLGEVVLTPEQYQTMVEIQGDVVQKLVVDKSMTDVEFAEMCRLAVPQLLDRAIKLALVSKDPKEVMAVAKEITDRGYGRVNKQQSEHEPEEADYLRRSWESFPKYVDEDAVVAEITDESKGEEEYD